VEKVILPILKKTKGRIIMTLPFSQAKLWIPGRNLHYGLKPILEDYRKSLTGLAV